MFFKAKLKPTKLKKVVYLFATTVLGILLSLITHALIEINYLRWAENNVLTINFYYGCAFPLALQISLLIIGAVGGFFLGRFWWRKVYIDRVWVKK